ncbi:MAG TPA: hypothetical protein PK133_09190 [Ferruginibacter sp.]|nr:hypothetical protein [Ferruginibacter sp.]
MTGLFTKADAQSRTSKIEYQKADREAIVNEVPFPVDMILKALEDTLEKMGYKGKESKGFIVYKGVKMPALGSGAYDLYFSVDRKSKKEKDISNVTMMISKGFDSFITEKSDPGLVQNAKTYLDNLRNTVAVYDRNQQITGQEEAVIKLEKKIESLTEDAADLQKKKKKLEKEIEDNIKEQADQQKELEKQRQVLSTLKGTNG